MTMTIKVGVYRNFQYAIRYNEYKGLDDAIINYYTAYVRVPEGLASRQAFTDNIKCHGGITFPFGGFSLFGFPNNEQKGDWIGWDYAHPGDTMDEYTLNVACAEARNVIDQLFEKGVEPNYGIN